MNEDKLIKALNEKKIEKDIRQCKKCSQYKTRIRDGKFPDQRNIKFVDENDQQWNGNVCPTCHVEVMKSKMKVSRNK